MNLSVNMQSLKYRDAWHHEQYRAALLLTVAAAVPLLLFLKYFLTIAENRAGFVPDDFILDMISPVNLSVFTFALTYFSVILCVFFVSRDPYLLLRFLQAYLMIHCFRMISMYMVPLEPPAGIIPLRDFFLENTFYSGRINLKDLFFSGHVATVFLAGLALNGNYLKLFFFTACFIMGMSVMAQHVHYAIDVFTAPFFAWGSWRLTGFFAVVQKNRNRI